ncbi:MAG: c-type cytochrome [Rhodocyclaceae bacterium]|nr:c-type cytochrome [Rhodocyclaceae bacterium]
MKKQMSKMIPIAVGLMLVGGACAADKQVKTDLGKSEFVNSCVLCHGIDGKGGGSIIELLKKSPPDLATLTKRNGGTFPVERVKTMIDGREVVKGHGDRDMPAWGNRYSNDGVKAAEYYGEVKYDMEMYTKSRIDALVDYLKRIQAK